MVKMRKGAGRGKLLTVSDDGQLHRLKIMFHIEMVMVVVKVSIVLAINVISSPIMDNQNHFFQNFLMDNRNQTIFE